MSDDSAIYYGKIRHRRFSPVLRMFSYSVFMVYLDLQQLNSVFKKSRWWSCKNFSLAWFRRRDFFDGKETDLYEAVADAVEHYNGVRPKGPIKMLTNLRYFGFIMNPITCYYCFDETGTNVETIVAEVTNTPWQQRCHYILNFNDDNLDGVSGKKQQLVFDKLMPVSPFQPMALRYGWRSQTPAEKLVIHIDVFHQNDASNNPVFDATLVLSKKPMTTQTMNYFIWRYPWMTLKVGGGVYWQALKLWLKPRGSNKIPFYGNPNSNSKNSVSVHDSNHKENRVLKVTGVE